MIAKKLAIVATMAMLALALFGCSGQTSEERAAQREAFGTPELPIVQGLLDLSPSRAVSILENFEYREHAGEGQWASDPSMFDVFDNGSYATLEKEISTGEAGWILLLSARTGSTWQNCTLEDLKAGSDPDRATIIMFPKKGTVFDTSDTAIEFIDTLFMLRMGAVAVESGKADGRIVSCVAKNLTGAVYKITEESPGKFILYIYPNSYWADGSYDELVAECKKQAEAAGCEYREFEIKE